MVRPISEFPAQVYHMHVDRTRRDGIVVSFDFPYDLVAGEDLSGICRQQCQSLELIGGQHQRLSAERCAVCGQVDRQCSEYDGLHRFSAG